MALFTDLVQLIDSNEIISTDRYLQHSKNCIDCTYWKSDLIHKGGLWRGEIVSSLYKQAPTTNLILGHSDRFVNSLDLKIFKVLRYRKVFGVNLRESFGYSFPMPLGLTNFTSESEYHQLFGDHSLLKVAHSQVNLPTYYSGSIYGNFSVETNRRARLPVARILSDEYGSFEKPDFTTSGRVSYLRKMAEANFVVCPEGNGIDTHRIWEALYMGSIPIIKRNRNIEPLLRYLPILVVDDWNELRNYSFLEESWYGLSTSDSYDYSWLKVSKWIAQLH